MGTASWHPPVVGMSCITCHFLLHCSRCCCAAVYHIFCATSCELDQNCALHALRNSYVRVWADSASHDCECLFEKLSWIGSGMNFFCEVMRSGGVSFTTPLVTSTVCQRLLSSHLQGSHLPKFCVSVGQCICQCPFFCLGILNWLKVVLNRFCLKQEDLSDSYFMDNAATYNSNSTSWPIRLIYLHALGSFG